MRKILPIFPQDKWGGRIRVANDGGVTAKRLPLHHAICDGAVPLPICTS